MNHYSKGVRISKRHKIADFAFIFYPEVLIGKFQRSFSHLFETRMTLLNSFRT